MKILYAILTCYVLHIKKFKCFMQWFQDHTSYKMLTLLYNPTISKVRIICVGSSRIRTGWGSNMIILVRPLLNKQPFVPQVSKIWVILNSIVLKALNCYWHIGIGENVHCAKATCLQHPTSPEIIGERTR